MTDTPPAEIARLQALHPRAVWRHEPQLPLDSIDLVASVMNQVRDEPIDKPTLARYIAALEAGYTFPPIVVREVATRRGLQRINLGGNHRTRAHIDTGRPTIDAWVVVIDDDLAAIEIAYHDNANHGLQPTSTERIAHALRLIAAGRTQTQAARTVGLSPATLAIHRNQIAVAERADRLGVAQHLVRIPTSARSSLASIKDDRLFVAVVETVAVERIPITAVAPLVGNVNAQPTLAAARKILAEHVRAHRGVAGAARGRGNPSRNPRIMAATAMSTLQALDPGVVADAATSDYDRQQMAKDCLATARQLKRIHDLLQTKVK